MSTTGLGTKRAEEYKAVVFDFAPLLGEGETISQILTGSPSVELDSPTGSDLAFVTGSESNEGVAVPTPAIDSTSKKVVAYAKLGVLRDRYKVKCSAVTSAGQVRTVVGLISIVDRLDGACG